MTREIIIQYTEQEIRVALSENGRLQNFFLERPNFKNPIGNIYKAKVSKVIPTMESAFVNIGLSKAAFLNIGDIDTNSLQASESILNKGSKNFNTNKTNLDNSKQAGEKTLSKEDIHISNYLSEEQDVIVQVYKGQINSKGASVTTSISIPGRNLVYVPGDKGVSLSKQIVDGKEKFQLKQMLNNIKGQGYGIIVRTYGRTSTEEEFRKEIEYLEQTWEDIIQKAQKSNSPCLLFEESNVIYRIFRDNLGQDVDKIVIDDKDEYLKMQAFLKKYMPNFCDRLILFEDTQDIFDAYSISSEISSAMSRKVPLSSGGYLFIDQAEALTAIDVNTGRYVGASSHAEAVLQTNLEAVAEIVHQLKLRNIGGIIIIDFIDMHKGAHRQQVYSALKAEMSKDRSRSQISTISEMGLVEMTRQRTQDNFNKLISQTCFACDGTGLVLSCETIFFNICRELNRLRRHKSLPAEIHVLVHPDISDYIEFENREGYNALIRKLGIRIKIVASSYLHIEQYKIVQIGQKNKSNIRIAKNELSNRNQEKGARYTNKNSRYEKPKLNVSGQ